MLSKSLISILCCALLLADCKAYTDYEILREESIISALSIMAQKKPIASRLFMEKLISHITDPALAEEQMKLVDSLFSPATYATDGVCNVCKVLLGVAKIVLRFDSNGGVDIDDAINGLTNNLLEYCEVWYLSKDDDQINTGKEMCQSLRIQGPYGLRIIWEADNSDPDVHSFGDICRNLNACFVEAVGVATDPSDLLKKSERERNRSKKGRRPSKNLSLEERKAAAIKVAQLTDIHVEPEYQYNGNTNCGAYVCCLPMHGQGDSWYYGHYQCNIPQRTMEIFIDEVAALQPDFAIFSGDIPPHSFWDETVQSQLNCSIALTNVLKAKLSTTRVFPCIGNHEMYPTNLFSAGYLSYTMEMTSNFAGLWTDLAGFNAEQNLTLINNGYYYMQSPIPNLYLLSLSTNYMYTYNYFNSLNHPPENTTQPLTSYEAEVFKEGVENALSNAAANSHKVIVINYHPPGSSDIIISESHWYEDLMVQYKDTVVLQIAGHTHTDEFRLLKDDMGAVQSMVYVAPSMDTSHLRNPSMRMYYLDPTTFLPIDYEQYYLNVSAYHGSIPRPNVVHLYNATTEYDLQDLTPASWNDLLIRFQTDDNLLLTHRWLSRARAGPEPTSCDAQCKKQYTCRQMHANYDEYKVCAAPDPVSTVPTTSASSTWLPLIPDVSSSVNLQVSHMMFVTSLVVLLAMIGNF